MTATRDLQEAEECASEACDEGAGRQAQAQAHRWTAGGGVKDEATRISWRAAAAGG